MRPEGRKAEADAMSANTAVNLVSIFPAIWMGWRVIG